MNLITSKSNDRLNVIIHFSLGQSSRGTAERGRKTIRARKNDTKREDKKKREVIYPGLACPTCRPIQRDYSNDDNDNSICKNELIYIFCLFSCVK